MTEKAKIILKPLYFYAFIEGLIFWYAIEKVLWSNSGVSPGQIVLLGIIAQSSQILIEVPSSVIADRWSRRKTLILSSCFMLAAILIVVTVQSFISFAVMSLMWAFYFAFQSGTINAYIYDLLKEQNEESQYRKSVSRFYTLQLSGLLISSLASSLLITWGNLLTPYWVTLITSVVAIIILIRMHDPPIERSEETLGTLKYHVKNAYRNVHNKAWLRLIFIALAFVTAGRFIWYEYFQLFALDREVAAVLFGIMLAFVHVGNIIGSEFAHKTKSPNRILIVSLVVLIASNLILIFTLNPYLVIGLLATCFFGSQASTIVLDESLQHQTKSELRATTLSLANLFSRIFFAIGAVLIIALGSSAESIAILALSLFVFMAVYLPVKQRLVAPD